MQKIYLDAMKMPKIGGFQWIIAARDDLTLAAEGKAVKNLSAKTVEKFIHEELIYRYGGMIGEIVTDNGAEAKAATAITLRRFGIPQPKISPYNSKGNGVVERGHFDTREALVKSCEGDLKKWPDLVPQAFYADRITVRASTGFPPFFLLYGTEPILPFDIIESTFLVDGFRPNMTTSELLALRIQQLEKRPADLANAAATLHQTRYRSKEQFEKQFAHRVCTTPFTQGDLVLVRNTQIEKSHSRKAFPRYTGPYEVVTKTKGGSYILKELNGAVSRQGVAAFRLIPYYRHKTEDIPDAEPLETINTEILPEDSGRTCTHRPIVESDLEDNSDDTDDQRLGPVTRSHRRK